MAHRERGDYILSDAMSRFELHMEIDGISRTKRVEIRNSELRPKLLIHQSPEYQEQYRQNIVNRYAEKWAVSKLKLSAKEIKHE